MAQVPYTPYSTVQPTDPGERIAVNTPPAAFGENIGAALKQAGTTFDQVGNELFQRALSFQELKNENEARDLQLQFAKQSAPLVTNYDALEGKDKVDQLVPHLNNLQALHDKIAGTASNPMVRRMLLNDTAPFIQREILSASKEAGTANKNYTVSTLQDSATLAVQAAAQHPDDEPYVEQQRDSIRDKVQTAAMMKFGVHDPNDPNVTLAVNNALSGQRTEQILSIAKNDAIAGQKAFQKYSADLTNPADMMRVQSAIEGHVATVAATTVANRVINSHRQPDGGYDVPIRTMMEEARTEAAKAAPGNELAPETAALKIQGFAYHDQYIVRQEQMDAKKQINDILAQGDIRDVRQLQAMPGMDEVIRKLPVGMQTAPQLQGYMNRFYSAVDKQTNQYWRTTINGLKYSDPVQFMNIDSTDAKYHLNKNDIITIQNDQQKIAREPQGDPRVNQAMSWIKGAKGAELHALGVDVRDKQNPDDYDHFVGSLQEALQEFREDKKRPPTFEEVVDQIAPSIIKTQMYKPGIEGYEPFGFNKQPAFKGFDRPTIEDVPEKFKTQLSDAMTKKGMEPPTDTEVVRTYARQQFNELFKKQATKPE